MSEYKHEFVVELQHRDGSLVKRDGVVCRTTLKAALTDEQARMAVGKLDRLVLIEPTSPRGSYELYVGPVDGAKLDLLGEWWPDRGDRAAHLNVMLTAISAVRNQDRTYRPAFTNKSGDVKALAGWLRTLADTCEQAGANYMSIMTQLLSLFKFSYVFTHKAGDATGSVAGIVTVLQEIIPSLITFAGFCPEIIDETTPFLPTIGKTLVDIEVSSMDPITAPAPAPEPATV